MGLGEDWQRSITALHGALIFSLWRRLLFLQNYSYRLGGYFIRLLSAYEPGGVGRVKMGAGAVRSSIRKVNLKDISVGSA